MEKCLPKYSRVYGSTYFRYSSDIYFRKVVHHIRDKINGFILKKDKEPLKDICLYLSNYLIKNKNPPNYYASQRELWERSLNEWLNPYYEKLNGLGECPLIMNKNDLEILKLKYEVDEFCKERNRHLTEISLPQGNPKPDSDYSSRCDSYNEWIDGKEKYFTKKKKLLENCYEREKTQKDRRKTCNIMDPETFSKLPKCRSTVQKESSRGPTQENKSLPEVNKKKSEGASMLEDQQQKPAPDILKTEPQPEPQSQLQHEVHSALENGIGKESQSISPVRSSSESSSIKTKDGHEDPVQHTQSKLSVFPKSPVSTESQKSPVSITLPTSLGVSGTPIDYQNIRLSSGSSNFPDNSMPSKILGRIFKKKKNIKRKQVRFLRILLPSLSDKKNKYLTRFHTESTLYDDEEIIKKLKIHEHNTIKNTNILKRKKERFKTIIEVHMEVLEEFRNEEWEHKKKEFLHLCLELFAKAEYSTYRNLTNEELIMENTKSINDIEKQKILWNKWVKEHSNISEKLKKTNWFNNLKNEWKNEKDSIKNSVQLKMNFSNENQKFSFLEKEKDLWKKWISKKHMIIEQYLQQKWFDEFTQEFLNMSDEYVNEESKNNISLLNSEELQSKEFHEELYSYIKKKLIAKLCILVFMMVLEDCKTEDFIKDEESHLDNSINDWKTDSNLGRKSDAPKQVIHVNDTALEHRKNGQIRAQIGQKSFRQEIEEWIREDDTAANYIYNENSVE
ncbi:STP1 protein [Plasmodium malariae]|uniref:STP1 protein n=1 Tax=Plasmodium malariae TaxID=5858 RepID=A0A1D3JHU1_PLAMA|nr:STP1 protein [Plasmodium malariae]SBT86013.1 STP1 protein [Plasmodium malariae]